MRYIRFLKPPKVHGSQIKTLITVTSDLGESFLPEAVQLSASLRSAVQHDTLYLRKKLQWEASMRSIPLTFDFDKSDIVWPVKIHVTTRDAELTDHFERGQNGLSLPPIISAWSDILDLQIGINEAARMVERRFQPLSDRPLCIWEETGESIARHIWDAGIALSAYVEGMVALQPEPLSPADQITYSSSSNTINIIELGAGCGIVGISLAQSIPNCNVLLTDLPEAREIAERNVSTMTPAVGSCASFQELDWEIPLPEAVASARFDLVLVADCTYNPDSAPALVQTLVKLANTSQDCVVLLSMKVRHESELVFFDLMEKAGFLQKMKAMVPLPEVGCDPDDALVFVFHHHARNVAVDNDLLSQRKKSVFHFLPV
ncbi:uncharacterized protein PV09_05481 [Verruconis gallopava]|uniref:Uncharacterized protein n=1 Tax=Verruconis gallopava TaxID=253628 RepID=A0A0D1XLF7_9PEZI|nr:uncharacterized protein PV09_05481 [Verruconis gallopava]KIW03261.1 hypothetical protein PV09_05481 [Verruconis gallopava]